MYNELCSALKLDEIFALEFEHEEVAIKMLEGIDDAAFPETLQELNDTLIENNSDCFDTIEEIRNELDVELGDNHDQIIQELKDLKNIENFIQLLQTSLDNIDCDSPYIDSVKALESLKTACKEFILKNLGPLLGKEQSSKLLQLLKYSPTYALSNAAKIINSDVKVQQKIKNERVKNRIFDDLGIQTMINNLNVNAKDLRNSLSEYENIACLPLQDLLKILDNLSNTTLNGNEEKVNAWLLDFIDKANTILKRLEKFTPEDLKKKIFENEINAATKIVAGLTAGLDSYKN